MQDSLITLEPWSCSLLLRASRAVESLQLLGQSIALWTLLCKGAVCSQTYLLEHQPSGSHSAFSPNVKAFQILEGSHLNLSLNFWGVNIPFFYCIWCNLQLGQFSYLLLNNISEGKKMSGKKNVQNTYRSTLNCLELEVFKIWILGNLSTHSTILGVDS